MTLSKDFSEFLQSLNDNGVRYLVIGGYAVAFHGHPRYTKDLDVWVWLDPANAEHVVQALRDFGFASLGLTASDFLELGVVVQLGYPPHRIDMLTSAAGVDFAECYERRVQAVLGELEVPFIDLEDLKRNKAASGRAQDLADNENLR